jgi:outer membrane protein assembly factor BamB
MKPISMFASGSFLSSLVVGSLLQASAADWPQWRGPNRDGISQEAGSLAAWPKEGPKRLWSADVGIGYGAVSVSKGQVFVMGNVEENDNVYALEEATGKVQWKHTYPCASKDPNGYPGTRSTPTVNDGLVYTVSRQGHLFCLEAKTGKVKWSKDYRTDFASKVPQWGFSTSVLVEGDSAIVETSGAGASLVAFRKGSGELIWKVGDDAAAYSSPVAFDHKGQRCLASLNAVGLVVRAAKDGAELYRFPWKTSYDVNAATPVVANGKIFISSGYNTGCALVDISGDSAKEVWRNKNMRNHVNSCVLVNGHLFGFDESELKCLSWETGEVKWSEKKYKKGAVTLVGDKLLLYSNRAQLGLAEASAEGYKELAYAPVIEGKEAPSGTNPDSWANPVLANGRIYCRSLNDLVCLEAKGK